VPSGSPRRVALTGGIATGKSHCLQRFTALGAPTIDADLVAREVVAPGSPTLASIVARFGPGLIAGDGSLDRALLGRVIFTDPAARHDLNALLHPMIYERIQSWYDRLAGAQPAPRAAIAGVPLLFETGREQEFDWVVVTACRPEQQLARLIVRDRMSKADALLRIRSQMPIEKKAQRGDDVIDTSGTIEETDRQVASLWAKWVTAEV
jgi:dephospho-CoA kinase